MDCYGDRNATASKQKLESIMTALVSYSEKRWINNILNEQLLLCGDHKKIIYVSNIYDEIHSTLSIYSIYDSSIKQNLNQ